MPRVAFDELAAATRQAVTIRTGQISAAHTAGGSMKSAIAALLGAGTGPVVGQGIPADDS